jgi:hypothetical protein
MSTGLAQKKQWTVYYVTDEGQFGSKRISPLMVAYYKSKRERYIKMVCNSCYGAFTVFYKNPKELEAVECPSCAAAYYADNKEDDNDDDNW